MIIVEHIKDGENHIDGNAASIAIFLKYSQYEICHIFCGQKHFECIKNLLKKNNIVFDKLQHHCINPYNSFVREYKLILFDLKIIKLVFTMAKQLKENKIVFLYTSTFLLYYIKFICLFNHNMQVLCYLHGDLEKVNIKEYVNTFSKKNKIIQFVYAYLFGLKVPLSIRTPRNLKYLVYGESIKKNLLKLCPNLRNESVIAIPHPYLYDKSTSFVPFENNVIRFGNIGLVASRKNVANLTKLINTLDRINDKNFSLIFSGKILDKTFFKYISNLNFIDKEHLTMNFLSSEKRNDIIKNIDYSIFAYRKNSYKLIASGAFIDAINYEKPIIAISNDYIKYYFEKYGNIGYLCNSYEEFESKILDIINNYSITEYREQVSNIIKIKQQENIENIVKYLKIF